MELTTLCYLEQNHSYLMLHRIKKKEDVNAGKWIGLGGHFEYQESPEECVCREVLEETGLRLERYRYRGIVTFIYNDHEAEYMSLFTATRWSGELTDCDEGVLQWIPKDQVWKLNLWAGDRIFLRLLEERETFFSLKLVYHDDDLVEASLDGERISVEEAVGDDGGRKGYVEK